VIIILLCLIWVFLIIKIASDINDPVEQFTPSLARPQFNIPTGRSRIGWMIKQKINSMELQLRPAPLLDVASMDSPVLIFTYNRADYLERTLWNMYEHHPAHSQQAAARRQKENGNLRSSSSDDGTWKNDRMAGAPIIISQDGPNTQVQYVIETYRQLFEMKLGIPLIRIEHPRVEITMPPPSNDYWGWEDTDWQLPYKQLAAHYGWALEQTFSGAAYDGTKQNHNRKIPTNDIPLPKRVILLEEDIEIANDFFSLMNATADLLDEDDTLLAVSAFNDNGKEQFVADATRLVRSDFFPGLGWMMSRAVWDGRPASPHRHPEDPGLKQKWPDGFWDDWLRENANRRGRQIIRPEVSRTFHFGNIHGASEGENNAILNKIELEENNIRWEDRDLSYLKSSVWARNYWNRVSNAKLVENAVEAKSYVAHSDVRLEYTNYGEFMGFGIDFDIMQDEKAGVPRTAYEGIVEIRYGRGKYFVFLTPPYVRTGGQMPEHFGRKAWKDYSKADLMKELGIKEVTLEDKPVIGADLDWW